MIDIYDTKIDDDAKKALLQADEDLRNIGVVPPIGTVQCTQEAEKEEYSRINWEMVGKISALESMLASAKKELSEANETIAKLKASLSRYECRVKGE